MPVSFALAARRYLYNYEQYNYEQRHASFWISRGCLEVLIQSLECYVLVAKDHINQQLDMLRGKYPHIRF